MNKFRRSLVLILSLMLLILMTGQALAGLKAVGPTDPVSTLPSWYQDINNLPLQLCLDQNGMCLLPGGLDKQGNVVVPNFLDSTLVPFTTITTTGPINDNNFPGESFYYSAEALLPIDGDTAKFAYVLEAAYLAGVIPDTGVVFLRTDLQKMNGLTPNSTYRVIHPYGEFTFDTDSIGDTTGGGGVAVRQEDPAGTAADWMPPLMKSAAITNIGPFLTPADGVFLTRLVNGETHSYLGDPAAATGVQVTGSPTGTNYLRIERILTNGVPVTGVSWQTDLWFLSGRVFTGQIPSPMTINRVTYARDANSVQVDVFASALPSANLSISGTGITNPVLMTRDATNTDRFFTHIPQLADLPTDVVVTNSLDNPPIPYPVVLVDEVIITQAFYNPVNREILVKAFSRDKVSPPTLSISGFALPNTLDAGGSAVLPLPVGAIPPETIQVVSSHGGQATAEITVVIPPPAPVAVDDSAVTAMNSAIAVNVLANDTSDAGIVPSSVTVVDQPASGATAVAGATGVITYTPLSTFSGSETFTYTVKDIFGQTSNTATVTVTVHEPPSAGNDGASAVVGTTENIDVIANDFATSSSINSTTVNIVSPATCGSTVVLANGTINFTAPADVPPGDGTCSFSYVVSDTFTPPALSNVATVTVTITPPPAPVAIDDAAATLTGSAVIINVIANDTSAVSTINPATVAVTAPSGGTATANLNGTVTYTPPATPGSYTFTYTVMDSAATPLISNSATVTVTVDQGPLPPVAVDDPAIPLSIPMNSTTGIDLIANDVASQPATIDPATVAIATYPAHGTVTLNANGSVTYVSTKGYIGADSFTYTVKDNTGLQSNIATVSLTTTAPPPVAGVSLTSTKLSPQTPNTSVTFVASATGGSGSYEYRFWLNSGSGYVVAQPYSTASSWTWTPSATGTYDLLVDVRNEGSTAVREASTNLFQYKIATPATSVTLVENLASPQPAGTSITFTATASGGSGPYEYRFWVNEGNGYAVARDYSATNTFTWKPTKSGIYDVMVDTRVVKSAVFRDALATKLAFKIAPLPATGVTITPSVDSPQAPGSSIVFTAVASGGTGPYEYRFWINAGGTYLVAQNYTTTNTFTWTPAVAGNYDVMVDTRAVGSTNFREALAVNSFYQIKYPPASGVTAITDKPSPQPINAPIVVTAAGIGGSGKYEYRFWLNSGSGFVMVQDYSSLPTWTWFPTATGNFDLLVDVRNAGTTSVRDSSIKIFLYQIQ